MSMNMIPQMAITISLQFTMHLNQKLITLKTVKILSVLTSTSKESSSLVIGLASAYV